MTTQNSSHQVLARVQNIAKNTIIRITPPIPFERATLAELLWVVGCASVSVEEAPVLVAEASLEASVHPSELHTKFHVLGCVELLLPAVPATVPVRDIVPSAESLVCGGFPVDKAVDVVV